MATQVQLRDGTTSEHSSFTGAAREVTVDTDKDVVVVHDGSTAGGIPLAKEASVLPLAGGTMTGDVSLGDNIKAKFGAGNDLQIYSDGTSSYIKETSGAGSLFVDADFLTFRSVDGTETKAKFQDNGYVKLYHNNLPKLATTSTGIDVTGSVNGLEINTTATSNLGLGTGAVDSITTGDYNVGVGDNALSATTTGNYNTADGYQALYSNTTGGSNTAIGYAALAASTTGYRNTAVGHLAGTALTTGLNNVAVGKDAMVALTTGSGNVAVGKEALDAITTGSNTVAIGTAALSANTSGTSNTAVGHGVLAANTTGGENVAMGYAALDANTTASNNVGIGYFALSANTTGNYNTANGYQSLYSNTTGTLNTAVGSSALYNNTTGGENIAIGTSTLYYNTTGANNTAVGKDALQSNTTGNGNIGTGYRAGLAVTTGSNNILIGYRAGYYATNLTTGSNNILIGAYSRTAGTSDKGYAIGYDVAGSTNTITIGYGTDDIRTTHGSTSWATVSDERYKKDIVDSTAGLSLVNALQPRTFKYKTLGELPTTFNAYKADSTEVFKNSVTNHGFIAQEVKAAIDADASIKDGFVMWNDTRPDGSQEVAEAALIPILVKAIQELSSKNDALEARLIALENA